MTRVNWLIEKYVFDNSAEDFLVQLKRQGYIYKETSYLKFHPNEAEKFFDRDDCVLFRGSLNLGRDVLKTSWVPGAYMNERNLRCSTYYTYFGSYLLNDRYFMLSLGELIRRKEEICDYFNSDGDLFIKPDSNMKLFHAGVFNLKTFDTIQALGNYLKRDETTFVVVSGKREITREWRFFAYKNEAITGSLYLVGEERVNETIKGGYLEQYVSEVLKKVEWHPDTLYTIDICESNGELYVLELGSFSCAGEYGSDLNLLIEMGAKAALEDYEAVT